MANVAIAITYNKRSNCHFCYNTHEIGFYYLYI